MTHLAEPIIGRTIATCSMCADLVNAVTFLFPDYVKMVALCPGCGTFSYKRVPEDAPEESDD